jgi:DNA mismatch repair protein Mlh1 C-terminus
MYVPGNKNATNVDSVRIVRPSPVITTSDLVSIRMLRRRLQKSMDGFLQKKSDSVGVVSQHRSLVQWQEELLFVHHSNLAQAMFYQLALAHFGGNRIATFQPSSVKTLIENVLQMEENLQDQWLGLSSDDGDKANQQQQGKARMLINETNKVLA